MKSKNKKMLFLLVTVLALSLSACNSKENDSSSSIEAPISDTSSSIIESSSSEDTALPAEVQLFIDCVTNLNVITLDSRKELNAAYFCYYNLSDNQKTLAEVITAKEKLDSDKASFLVLYEAYEMQRLDEEAAYAYIDLADSLSDVNSIILEDIVTINKAEAIYTTLSDNAKSIDGVAEAKVIVDAAKTRYAELEDLSADEYQAVLFIAQVNKLNPLDNLLLSDEETINELNDRYLSLTDTIKNQEAVQSAKIKLDTYVAKISHLKTLQEKAETFMDMVFALPTYDNLEWQSSTQLAQITAAENYYNSLTDEVKQVAGVSSAYNELLAIKETFSNLKQPYDITKFSASFNGFYPNLTARLVFSRSPRDVLVSDYNIPAAEIESHVKIYLNMYYEGPTDEPLYRFDITVDYNITIAKLVETLQQLKTEGNPKAISGHGYNFTVNVEALTDIYASSKYSDFFGGQKITF